MSHNALILAEWASSERLSPTGDPELDFMRHELLNSALHVRFYTLLAILKLRFWIVVKIEIWSVLPSPSVSDLKEVAGIDVLYAYDRLKSAASHLSLKAGVKYHESACKIPLM
jgi:hypothetical protein